MNKKISLHINNTYIHSNAYGLSLAEYTKELIHPTQYNEHGQIITISYEIMVGRSAKLRCCKERI